MKIKPLFDRVLLKPYKEETTNSLIIHDNNDSDKMEVVSLGNGDNFVVKEGDIVLINKYSGSEFIVNNQSFTIIKECDILGIITKGEEL